MVDFNSNNAAVVMTHLFIAILISLNGNSLGLMGGCAFNDLKVATSMVPMLLLPLTVFSGFLANKRQFYVWIGWLQYVSPLKYSFEALATNEFVGRNY
jgi:ABC-type multidrug transport system permease subunit